MSSAPRDDQPVDDVPADDAGPDPVAGMSGADAAKEALARARAAAAASPQRRTSARPTSASATRSGARADDRDPALLGASVDRLLRDRGWTESAAVGGLTGRWAEIVGADVAEHVRPETFEQAADGRGLMLVLRADSTAWATTLQYMLPAVRSRIDAELGVGVVRDISILGPAAPSWKHGRLSAPGRGPRDTYG